MIGSKKAEAVRNLISSEVVDLGYDLWGVEYVAQGKNSILRIYIDSDNGITVDDCARVSHQVSGILDVEDIIAGEYNLEVSSPGLERPLFSLEQFEIFSGHKVGLRLSTAIDGRKTFSGKIVGVVDEEILIEVEGQTHKLPYSYIAKANLSADLDKRS
ncbi:MAG: ribosome maturation factor RimP [Gammaproteobacteria bacterium]|nr:MAG: ribosome maturation factor RimP [Gammaproteobacteria bacterium]